MAEACDGSPTAVPQNLGYGSPTGCLRDREASKTEDQPTASKTSLVSQPEANTGDKPYMCGECGYRAARKSLLSEHTRTHTGEKPYKCDQCDYSAARKSNLNQHLAMHTGDKPYMCGECG
ncbi:zinc finger protein 300-like [Branchiostoma floridae]|nr:zinc finger protein 300-like [Branchiostoma floridae]